MKIIGTRISTKYFTWDRERMMFVAEASDLKGFDLFSTVFDDACDEGFTLVSEKTGREITVTYHETIRDSDSDVLVEIYKPYKSPFEFTVHVLND